MINFDGEEYTKRDGKKERLFNKLLNLQQESKHEPTILDIGCGNGELTARLPKEFDANRVIGIDKSESQITEATRLHNHPSLEFKQADITTDTLGINADIILSNAAMHWVKNQKSAYNNIKKHLAEDGVVLIHQGYNGCYKELHDIAEKVFNDLYGNCLDTPSSEDALYYPTLDEYINLVNTVGFTPVKIRVTHDIRPIDSHVETFTATSLNIYREPLTPEQEQTYISTFQKRANNLTHETERRLYATLKNNC
jgi:trans-aconitate 2-methyltransferase